MLNTESIATAAVIASTGLALYAGHHLGDYWVQTDHDAACKGKPGWEGRLACLRHVASYTATQAACLALLAWVMGGLPLLGSIVALGVSAVTHYLADRREFGLMIKLARLIPGKANFLKLGVPRAGKLVTAHGVGHRDEEVPLDNPSLGTGGWALDQSWHIALGVFVPALIIGAFA